MEKQAHDWGYRYTWPPTMGNLTPRQRGRIRLAEQAEAYIKHQQQQRQNGGGRQAGQSLSEREYDVDESRREWRDGFQ